MKIYKSFIFILLTLLMTSCVFDWKEDDITVFTQDDFPEFSTLLVGYLNNLSIKLCFDMTIGNESSVEYVGALIDDVYYPFQKEGSTYYQNFHIDEPCTVYVIPCACIKGNMFYGKKYKVELGH